MYPMLRHRDDLLKMLEELVQNRLKILDQCGQLTPEQLNDPVYPGTWSLLKNLAHLATAERYMFAFIQSRPGAPAKEQLPKDPPLELPAIRTALDEAHAEVIAFLKSHPESVLEEKCVFGRQLQEETVGGLMFHIIEHEIGHRSFILHKLARLTGK